LLLVVDLAGLPGQLGPGHHPKKPKKRGEERKRRRKPQLKRALQFAVASLVSIEIPLGLVLLLHQRNRKKGEAAHVRLGLCCALDAVLLVCRARSFDVDEDRNSKIPRCRGLVDQAGSALLFYVP